MTGKRDIVGFGEGIQRSAAMVSKLPTGELLKSPSKDTIQLHMVYLWTATTDLVESYWDELQIVAGLLCFQEFSHPFGGRRADAANAIVPEPHWPLSAVPLSIHH